MDLVFFKAGFTYYGVCPFICCRWSEMWHDVEKICEQSGRWQGTGSPRGSRTTWRDEEDVLREQPLKYGRKHSVWITILEEWSWQQPHMGGAPGSYGICRSSSTGCWETEGGNSQRCISQQLKLHHVLHCILPKSKLGRCWVFWVMKFVLRLQCTLRDAMKFSLSDRRCLAVICAPFLTWFSHSHCNDWVLWHSACSLALMVHIPV